MRRAFAGAVLSLAFLLSCRVVAQTPAQKTIDFRFDFSKPAGPLRPLHGINKGPLGAGGLIDVTARQKELGIPLTRLHDCHWPNPDVVDIHALFPNPDADPDLPASYDFRLTDEYVAAVRATGAAIVYRLGESIEHTSVKRYVHPPKDSDRWARVALGIVRHVNEGWAGGTRLGVRYWEVWNEPDNRPACWTGTDADYFALYAATVRALKTRFPELKVGGPAVGNTGELKDGRLTPSPFLATFLDFCRREKLPLDFFSWHCYTADPEELVLRAREVRRLLDSHGFTTTESHLNEWNFLPDGKWDGLERTAEPETRQQFYEAQSSAAGAAFLVASLLRLQDAPLDQACLFHGELGGFGLFSEHGVPQKNFYALRAFRRLLENPRRVARFGGGGGVTAAAGLSERGDAGAVLLSHTGAGRAVVTLRLEGLPWRGVIECALTFLDGRGAAERADHRTVEPGAALRLEVEGPAVVLVRLRPQ